ncbi:polysaccharide pyruvyl transferase family protein [Bifidobacterium subtile]|uniref:polysaccharide pyruvyl transferase family protein n=3 Tax=Bifidobacterium subtile TaxID=77635 RepID=UPI00138E366B|nr:polysaccharide pyruvyl transferase family protein [Bifidobacterium subtile]QOL36729.1 polysaccharide pyruvyl transferase family protein [Bifidobacterium subtile]
MEQPTPPRTPRLPDTSRGRSTLLSNQGDTSHPIKHREQNPVHITSTGERITYTDTTITDDSAISAERGEHLVLDKFAEFRKARLVITDRLHGMIFSAITGTPCIALNNSNGKVGMEYFWLQDLPYITFAEDVDALESLLPDMMNIADTHYPAEYFMRKFDSLTDLLS